LNGDNQSHSDEELVRAILQYLLEHPDAKDTIEGILKWWLLDGRGWKRGKVQRALNLLASKEWLTKRETVPSKEIYGINKDRLQEIRSFLQQSDAGS
jgi:Fe2+ or Zn2+ uptake regulation protein